MSGCVKQFPMIISEVIARFRFWQNTDRIGPDVPWTHWRLHLKSTMTTLCRRKFRHFGRGAEFRPGAYAVVCSKIDIGDNVVIRPGTFLFASPVAGGGGIIIEPDVLIGSCVHFYTNNHEFADVKKPIIAQGHMPPKPSDTIVVRRGCWIGANVTILRGVEIGENSVVGAGSVVTQSVPPRVVAVGNPARIIREIG